MAWEKFTATVASHYALRLTGGKTHFIKLGAVMREHFAHGDRVTVFYDADRNAIGLQKTPMGMKIQMSGGQLAIGAKTFKQQFKLDMNIVLTAPTFSQEGEMFVFELTADV